MTVRATTTNAAYDAYRQYKAQLISSKAYLNNLIPRLQQDGVDAFTLRSLVQHANSLLIAFDAWVAVPGIVAAGRNYEADAAYDLQGEYTTLRALIVAARNSALPLFPRDATGRPVYETLDASGNTVTITYLATDVAALLVNCQAVVADIA